MENTTPKFRVDIVDLFQGHDEYGYEKVESCDNLEEAIEIARKITIDSLKEFKDKPFDEWLHFGNAGLVYSLENGALVWDGVNFARLTIAQSQILNLFDV